MALPSKPITRQETYLSNIAGQATQLPDAPITREEKYLDYIAKNGGGGGTGEGDMKKSAYDADEAVFNAGGIKAFVNSSISGKVDKVEGKGLSSNDYDDSAKAIVDNVTSALDGKVSKSDTAGLLKNDGTVDTNTYAQTSALSGYIAKSDTAGLVKNDGTIDTTTTGAVAANTSAISAIKDGTSMDSFADVEAGFVFDSEHLADTVGYARDNLYYKPFASQIYTDVSLMAVSSSSEPTYYQVSGTADSDYVDFVAPPVPFKKGMYKVVGCPAGGGNDTYSLRVVADTGSTPAPTVGIDTGSGDDFTINGDYSLTLVVRVKTTGGATKAFYPMITRVGYTGEYKEGVQPVTELLDAKQPKTLDTAITVDGVQKTTVEAALSAINTLAATDKTDIAAINGKIPSGASSSNKMATTSDVTGLQDNIIANTKLIKDTVGWSGKNKFDIEKWLKTNNVTYTKNGNEYTFTTSNALYSNHYIISDIDVDVILSSEITIPSGSGAVNVGFEMFDSQGRQITSRGASGSGSVSWLRMNWSTQGQIKVSTPMIRDADILDPTYEPYFGSTAFPRSEQAVLGAKQFLPMDVATIKSLNTYGTWSGNAYTFRNATFEIVTDTDGNITGIKVNSTGVTDGYVAFTVGSKSALTDSLKYYCCTSQGSDSTFFGQAYDATASSAVHEYGDGILIGGNGHNYNLQIVLIAGSTYTNKMFVPQLLLPTDTDRTFAPYAMTNRELTDLGLVYRGAIPSGASLDDYVEVGIWDINGTNPTNLPTGSSGYVPFIVFPRWGHGNIKQIIISRNNEIYLRNKNDGESWSSWYKFAGTVVS